MTNFASPVRTPKGRVNLVPNPSFEYGSTAASTNFVALTNIAVGLNTDPANALRGSNSMMLTATSTGSAAAQGYVPNSTVPVIPVVGGTTYTVSYWVKTVTTARQAQVNLNWRDAINTNITTNTGTLSATAVGAWTQVSYTAVAPANAGYLLPRAGFGTGLVGDVMFVDCFVVEPTATLIPEYFDGSFAGARWRGTAHNSASESFGVDLAGALVQGVGLPVRGTDAASKSYVDSTLASGVHVTAVAQRINLVTNPTFGAGVTTGWTATPGTASVTYNASDGYSGTGSMSIGTSVVGAATAAMAIPAVAANTTYVLSVHAKAVSLVSTAAVVTRIEYFDGSDSILGSQGGLSVSISASTGWVRTGVTYLSPPSTVKAVIKVTVTGTASTDVVAVDAVLFELASVAGTYFDGSLAGSRWRGTAHDSASEVIAFDANNTAVVNVAAPVVGTDAANKAYVDTVAAGGGTSLDSDLVTIAALAPADDSIMQRKGGAWVGSTPATVKTDLAIVKGDVGLSNVDNTADASKPVSSATAVAIAAAVASAGVAVNDLAMMNIMGAY